MRAWQRCLLILALVIGLSDTLVWTTLWWVAREQDWQTVGINFNFYGEAWLEGILLHLALGVLIVAFSLVTLNGKNRG